MLEQFAKFELGMWFSTVIVILISLFVWVFGGYMSVLWNI